MNRCETYLELLSSSLDGTLTPGEAARLEAHLAACPQCRALKAELEAVHTALQNLPTVEAPAGLYDRIMEAVSADNVAPFAPPGKKKPAFRWQKWAAAAAMFAVMMAGYGVTQRPIAQPIPSASSPRPNVTVTGGSNSLPKGRSADAQDETEAIQPFSGDADPEAESTDISLPASETPVQSDPTPPPTPPPRV